MAERDSSSRSEGFPMPPAALMMGASEGPELFEVLKLAVRLRRSGVLTLTAPSARAEIWLQDGHILASFFNDLAGPQALTRALLLGAGTYTLERHLGQYPRNISQSTEHMIAAIEKILGECADQLWGAGRDTGVVTAMTANADGGESAEGEGEDEASRDGDTLAISVFAPPEIGRTFGKCVLEQEIGRGASSIVYRARHLTLDLPVVVKVLMHDTHGQRQEQALVRNEAQLLARLNHPHILRVFDFSERGQFHHLVMEYVDGVSLAGLIDRRAAIAVDEALPIFCQVAEAMTYAHGQFGVVHCDIKPSNILLTKAHEAKVADFGLAKATRMSKSQLAARDHIKDGVAGTPAYIAPEQVEGGWDNATHRSDIYALGATFYHALTGRPPFESDDPIELMAKRLRLDPVPPHLARPGIDRQLSDLVMTMLVRDPVHRVHTWIDLLGALYQLLEANDQERAASGDGKIIRRRSSFWTHIPALGGSAPGGVDGAFQAG
jgi:tRNA A-37 threonylcarbamoyl transferase component Bud32